MKTLILILDNLRSTYNVGAILRSAEAFAVSEIIFVGVTPFLDKGLPYEREKLRRAIHKTALGAEARLAFRRFSDLQEAISALKKEGFTCFALEQSPTSLNLTEFALETDSHTSKIALALGEETHGFSATKLSLFDAVFEIPMLGKKESFNVSVATGIALWECRRQDLIDASLRDKRKYLRKQNTLLPPAESPLSPLDNLQSDKPKDQS